MAEAWDDGSELSQPTTNTASVIHGGHTYGKGRGFIPLNNNNDNGLVGNNKSGNDGSGFGVKNNNKSSSGGWGFGDSRGRGRGGFHNPNDNDRDNNGLRGSGRGRQNDRDGDNNEDTDNKGFRGNDGGRHKDHNVHGDDNYQSRGRGGRGGFAGFGNHEEDGGSFDKKFNGDGEDNNNLNNDNKLFEGSAKHDYQPRGRGGRGGSRGEGRGGFAGFGNHEEDGGNFDKKFNGNGEDNNNVNNDNQLFEGSAKHDYQPRGRGGRGGSRGEGRGGFAGFGNHEEDGGGCGKNFNGDGEDNNVNNDNKGFEGSAKHDYQPRGRGGRGGSRGEGRGGFGGFGNHEEDGGGFGQKFNGDGEENNVNNDNKGFEGSAKHDYQPRGGGGRGGNRGGGRGSFINRNEEGTGESSGFGAKFNSDGDGDNDSKPSRGRDGRGRSDNNNVKEEDGENPDKPPPVTYIPPEISMDDDELFNGVDVGLNFSKYDEIKVTTTGVNFPGPIEDFKLMGLRNLVIDNIVKSGYTKPTPVQKHAMPIIMNGRDLMACAQTGSGKTAAFMVPIINDLLEHPSELKLIGGGCEPHCVVLLPTRELAVQIWRQALKFSKDSIIKCCVIYGGVATMHQGNQVANGCHILVATPGRLLDFVERRRVSFASIRYVVLDEADRMLDMGFLESIQKMMNHETMVAKGDRQTLMFSATFGEAVQSIAAKFLDNYLFLTVGIVGAACSDVEQSFCEVTKQEKRQKLMKLLENDTGNSVARTIVFVETKKHADVLATLLSERKIPTTSIHGDRMQQQREEALRDFISGRMPVLVATAVAARGLDIKDVAHVINYDMPKEIDEYVHRIGRTGRVGNRGKATSFLNFETDGRIIGDLVRVLKSCGQTVPDWLLGGGAHCDFAGGAKFGGQDVRRFGNDSSKAAPDEEW